MELLPETMYSLEFLRSIQEQKRAMMIEMTSIASVQEIMCPRLKGFFYFSKDVVDTLLMSWFTRKDMPADVLREMDKGMRSPVPEFVCSFGCTNVYLRSLGGRAVGAT
ncbi:hypothetical protein IscW_ISCW014607 [Ixodes scapularis]|uniref:Uncharacterized protein n=1 Tax=Ixodes scapularis TaxID=6945 RepID=B7QJQ1_IXOSC|nr:hypothetical protein IscW_ISCW014607 [Ixodes scapularis]|eukprot:XP_002415408.1 hypothetical protein IscW_ISCW014607 [Ixodes scapularis]